MCSDSNRKFKKFFHNHVPEICRRPDWEQQEEWNDFFALMKIKEAFSTGGHIFNLGHGITPNAEIKHVDCLIDTLKG